MGNLSGGITSSINRALPSSASVYYDNGTGQPLTIASNPLFLTASVLAITSSLISIEGGQAGLAVSTIAMSGSTAQLLANNNLFLSSSILSVSSSTINVSGSITVNTPQQNVLQWGSTDTIGGAVSTVQSYLSSSGDIQLGSVPSHLFMFDALGGRWKLQINSNGTLSITSG